ncbi:MAG: BamA/TamA family outer membrane protein [Pseudomonadota bacterium]
MWRVLEIYRRYVERSQQAELLRTLKGARSGFALARVAAVGVGLTIPSLSVAAERLAYDIEIIGAEDLALEPLLSRALLVYRYEDDGAPSLAQLRRRAENDVAAVERALRALGHYAGDARIDVIPDPERPRAEVEITVRPGPAFTLAGHGAEYSDETPPIPSPGFADPPSDLGDLGAPVGDPARAADILTAEAAAVAALRRGGYPFARFLSREAVADFERAELRVRSRFRAGPRALFGPLVLGPIEGVDPDYLRSYQTWEAGAPYDQSALAAFERALGATELFAAAAAATPSEAAAESGADPPLTLPVTLQAEPAPWRSIGLGARFSTDNGPEARVSFEHRNLLGANERFSAVLDGGAEDQSLEIEVRRPQFRRRDQDLVAGLELRRERSDAFNELAIEATFGVDRALQGPIARWFGGGQPPTSARAGAGLLVEASVIEDAALIAGGAPDETALLLGAPAFLTADASDDALNPTRGYRLRLAATPFFGVLEEEAVAFLTLDAQGSAYRALDEDADWVLAGRARLGGIVSAQLSDIPAPRRLFSGGGGSVRGYADRFVGALGPGGDPIGGRSVIEVGGEMRWRATESVGAVAFVEAGAVSADPARFSGDDLRVGAGSGLRYFSPIGPIGVDVGVPLDRRPEDEPYQLYFFIGQAF